jgi:hypothetical protein
MQFIRIFSHFQIPFDGHILQIVGIFIFIAHSTIEEIIYVICNAILNAFVHVHMPFPTTKRFHLTAKISKEYGIFRTVLHCTDGRHIHVMYPKNFSSVFSATKNSSLYTFKD